MTSFDHLQRTPEWHAARLGKITGSRITDVVGRTKTGSYAAARDTYKWNLVTERITGVPTVAKVTPAMQWGIDNEEDAKVMYSILRDVEIEEVGFILHPDLPFAGASPDGLIGGDGLIEVKCMETVNHLRCIHTGVLPDYYINQCQWQMVVTERDWCDLVLYDPRVPDELQMRVLRVEHDEDRAAELEEEVEKFEAEINTIINNLQKEKQ